MINNMIAVLSDDSVYYTKTESTVNVTTVELIARRVRLGLQEYEDLLGGRDSERRDNSRPRLARARQAYSLRLMVATMSF